ncbi:MAG: Cna B-type domain-containing protein, partial [Methanobrevibacter sp.]|nr:Cna B-type domain-containing protein [Methanobrevibacter sp.]
MIAGAIYVESKGNIINGSEFYYNTAINTGGAVQLYQENNIIDNSCFEHNNASFGGALYIYYGNSLVNNTNMSYNNASAGGAIYVFLGKNVTVDNSRFESNFAFSSEENLELDDESRALANGGAIYWGSDNGVIDHSEFSNNYVSTSKQNNAYGGAVHWVGNNATINNTKFTLNWVNNNGGFSEGGALSISDDNATVENCIFEKNVVYANGGAIHWMGDHGVIYNSTFIENNASSEGGAINGVGKNLLINNSTFTRNKALWYVGGALALDAYGTIDNSTFIENSSYKGGAIHWIDEGACLVNNSYFYKNHAMYAGGAISCDFYYYHADKYLQNTRFINNTCQNYGGAIASLDTEIDNCTFINNSANMGGAIHSYDSKINGSHFSDNSAKYGNDIYHSGTLDLIDLEVPDENIVYVPSDLAEIVRYNIGNSTRLMNNSYIGMCFERNSLLPKYGAYDESLQGLINVKSKDSIVEYLKLLIYDSFNSMEEVYPHEDDNYVLYPEGYEDYPDLIKDDKSNWVPISRTDYYSRAVHVFSDHDFRNSKHPVVQKILNDYNNGIRISQDQTKMVNGTMIKYHFSTLMSPASQSLFLFLITPIPKIDKTYLNTTDFVTVNDTVAFNITVNNTGDKPLVNITIKEIYNSTELEYIGHSDNKTWIKNNDTFTFYHDPDVGDIVIYNIYLENTCGKNLENTVFGNVYDPTQLEFVKCANADLIKNPDGTFLFVDELRGHRNKTLSLYFKILNKDEELAVMTPKIIKYSFSEDNTVLSTEGNIIVKKTYNHTFNDTNGNDFVVYDICLNNTCDSPLENITFNKVYDLTELEFINCTNVNLTKNADGTFFYSGVIKAHENVTSRLCFKVLNNNIDKTNRTLNVVKYYRIDSNLISQDGRMSIEREYVGRFSPINVGEAYTFTIWFKTLTNGTLVNNVSLNAHALREVLNATNKTTVYKPNLTVEKIALNSTVIVYVGDHIAFNITVNNTGDSNLYNLTINEIFNSTELKFIRYSDNTTWIRNNNTFIYNGTMGIGDIIAFNITVNNTGDCAISNMTISNIFDSTELVYFKGADGKVLIRNGETFILNQTLGIGECKNFTLWFKTLVKGNLTEMKPVVTKFNVTGDGSVSPNVVVSRAMLETLFPLHKCESSTLTVWFKTLTNGTLVNNVTAKAVGVNETPATNNTTVYRPNMTVEKITLNKTVYLGNQTSFTIIVRNTGDCDLGNVTVVEKSYTGLVLDSYVNGTGKWKRVGDKFVLDGVLAKGASASFRVIFNTTVSGNFTNVVVANSNVTKNKTTENKTVVVPVRVNVTKVWEDNKNQDGIRHTSVTIILLADGKEIKRVVLSQKDNWTYIFNELPMVKDGKVINYKVSEIPIENYTMKIINKTVDDFTVIVANNTYKFDVVNNHTPLVTSVNVTKVWNDEDNQDGIRPDNITVILRNDTGVVDEFVLNSTNGWNHTFPNLPVYINNGTLINYTVVEKNVPKGYVNKTVKVDSYNYIINNNHTTEVTSVNVTKDWNDDNNQDGIRPKNITVVLMNDTGVVAEIVLNASNGWKGNFSNLPVYVNNGTLINYTVAEKTVPDGYDMNIVKIDGYNYLINNNHTSEVTSVNVTKVWNDNDDQDGVRSADVTVVLKAYGDVVGTVTLNASNNWSASFSDLPVYNEGKLIEYSVEEVSVANYTSVVSSDSAYSFIVNNTHVPVVTSVDVVKVWNDANDQDGLRPSEITVVLLADGNVIGTATLSANNNWYASFEDLPVYSNGKLIKYSIEEISVANYTSAISNDTAYSFTVNNTHVPLITVVNITKVWRDDNNKNEEPVKVIIYADGVQVANVTLYPGNDWKFTFDDLPAYKDGKKINYTIGVVEGNRTVNMTGDNGNFTIIAEPVYNPDMTVQKITLDT